MTRRAVGRAYARAGLLGNPSDGYEGKALALPLYDFGAEVTIEAAPDFAIEPGAADRLEFETAAEAARALLDHGCYDGVRLLRGALRRFAASRPELDALTDTDERQRFHVRYSTGVPRQVGLGGSSAIVIAALRALAAWFGASLEPAELAELALAAEVEDLGIAAGPMDRVVQSYERAMLMDFRPPRDPRNYRPVDPALLPPLFIAWDPRGGRVSGIAHSQVRARWQRGDPDVLEAISALRRIVDDGIACLERGDAAGFGELVDRNFDIRASMFPLTDRDRELVAIARRCGVPAKMCGSGGAAVGVLLDPSGLDALQRAYAGAGYRCARPRLERPDPSA